MKMETVQYSAASIFAKTPKGLEEMAQRTYRLPARMRTLLIMIDGRTPTNELLVRAGGDEARSLLDSLLADGFISVPDSTAAVQPETPTARAAPPAGGIRPPTESAAAGAGSLTSAKQRITRFLRDALGPDADSFTGAVDKATSTDELRAIVARYGDTVRAAAGRRQAEEFLALGQALG